MNRVRCLDQELQLRSTPIRARGWEGRGGQGQGPLCSVLGRLGVARRRRERCCSRIRCRVCNRSLAGEAAADEYRRVLEEAIDNAWIASVGIPPIRERGRFLCKRFPQLARTTEDEVCERIASNVAPRDRCGWLTRSDFPLGEAAYLYMQARLPGAAVSDLFCFARRSRSRVSEGGSQ